MVNIEEVMNIMTRYPELRIRVSNFNLVGKNFSNKGTRKGKWKAVKVSEVAAAASAGAPVNSVAETLLPPLTSTTQPTTDPALTARLQAAEMAVANERQFAAEERARAAEEAASLRAQLAALSSGGVGAAAPPMAPASPSRGRAPPRALRTEEEEIMIEVPEGRMSKGVKTSFLPDNEQFRTVEQAAAAVVRAQSQVMKAQADLLRACQYDPVRADAAIKVQTNASLAKTTITSILSSDAWDMSLFENALQAKVTLADVMTDSGDAEAAAPLYQEVVAAQEAPEDALKTKHAQAVSMKKAGDPAGARDLLKEVIVGYTEQHGATDMTTVAVSCDLAMVLRVTGQPDAARRLYDTAIALQTNQLGEKHATTLTTRYNLASLLDAMDEREAARDLYEAVIVGQSETLGVSHLETLDTMYNLADLLESRRFKDFSRARELFVAVAAGYKATHGPGHAETLDAEERLRRANFRLRAKRNAAVHAVAAINMQALRGFGGAGGEGEGEGQPEP